MFRPRRWLVFRKICTLSFRFFTFGYEIGTYTIFYRLSDTNFGCHKAIKVLAKIVSKYILRNIKMIYYK